MAVTAALGFASGLALLLTGLVLTLQLTGLRNLALLPASVIEPPSSR